MSRYPRGQTSQACCLASERVLTLFGPLGGFWQVKAGRMVYWREFVVKGLIPDSRQMAGSGRLFSVFFFLGSPTTFFSVSLVVWEVILKHFLKKPVECRQIIMCCILFK